MDDLQDNNIEIEEVFVPASIWKRLGAFIIDMVLIIGAFGFAFTIFNIMYMIISGEGIEVNENNRIKGILSLSMIIGMLLYFSILESSSWQATVGKKAFSIIVTDYDTKRIGCGRAVIRTFGKYISNSLFFLGYLLGFFTEYKQMLHDLIAKTYVLEATPLKESNEITEKELQS